jgi:DNA adenine methylase
MKIKKSIAKPEHATKIEIATIRPITKNFGGKYYLRKFVISNFPPGFQELRYVEPCGGGASILLNKPRSKTEILCEKNKGLYCIYLAVRDSPASFYERLKKLVYHKITLDIAIARENNGSFHDYIDQAVNEYVLRRMSRCGLKKDFAWSNRLRGGQFGDVNGWETSLNNIFRASERLQGVKLFCQPALKTLTNYNRSDTFTYVDCPYLHETRVSRLAYAEDEMSTADHVALAQLLNNFKGKVLLSGYPSKLYGKLYKSWNVEYNYTVNHASQQKIKGVKTEMLYKNY